MQVILKGEIIQKLKEVGLKSGDTVMVHTSLGKMGYVCGGAQAVIEALMEVVGDSGTIMMPTQSWKIWIRRRGFIGRQIKRTGSSFGTTGRLMTKT